MTSVHSEKADKNIHLQRKKEKRKKKKQKTNTDTHVELQHMRHKERFREAYELHSVERGSHMDTSCPDVHS